MRHVVSVLVTEGLARLAAVEQMVSAFFVEHLVTDLRHVDPVTPIPFPSGLDVMLDFDGVEMWDFDNEPLTDFI
jgi:hypothetical protein